MRPLICLAVLCMLALAILAPIPASAQEEFKWPEEPTNLKVFSKDIKGERLRSVMVQFSSALGVRCSYCHVGEEGKPLSTYDFASDKNPNKDRARAMYKMLGTINDQLKQFNYSGEQHTNMWCHTCHQGRAKPMTLEEELSATYKKSGITAAIARYHELRDRYYGKGGYNFGEGSLNGLAYSLLGKKDNDGAIAFFQLNAEQFPQSGNVWDSLAEAYMTAGNNLQAQIYYRKSLELDPTNKNAVEKLHQLESGTSTGGSGG